MMESTNKPTSFWIQLLLAVGAFFVVSFVVLNQSAVHSGRKLVAPRTIASREEFEAWKKQLQSVRSNLKDLEISTTRLVNMKLPSGVDFEESDNATIVHNPATASCRAKYGTRRFFTNEEVQVMQDTYLRLGMGEKKDGSISSTNAKATLSVDYAPPLLYSFPGSGNTWTRLLIEYATGIVSGSLYNDHKLADFLPGELFCSHNLSVVKAHPSLHHFSDLVFTDPLANRTVQSGRDKCARGGVLRFTRAIVLLRDPFDALWSEFMRRASDSHVGALRRHDFDEKHWIEDILSLASVMRRSLGTDFFQLNNSLPAYSHRLYVRYEDLKDPARRRSSLQQIVDFLQLPPTTSLQSSSTAEETKKKKKYHHLRADSVNVHAASDHEDQLPKEQEDRIDCAFQLADHRRAHRQEPSRTSHSRNNVYVDKQEVWRAHPEIVCRIWMFVGPFAAPFGYRIWNDLDCRQVKPYMTLQQQLSSAGKRVTFLNINDKNVSQ